MAKTLYVFINGILTRPSDPQGWTDRAVTYIQAKCECGVAEKFEYFSGALTRRLRQGRRVDQVAAIISDYQLDHRIVLVGHSNGCDIILRLLEHYPFLIREAHLFAAAVEKDFNKNGLNEAITDNRLGIAHVYVSRGDEVLKYGAGMTSTLFGWAGFGYGTLGYSGPINIRRNDRVFVHRDDLMNHGSWLTGENFIRSMEFVTRGNR
jgi:pimeloyl-ACP methyl ester carboxylesterase